jgi:hypothetical protein
VSTPPVAPLARLAAVVRGEGGLLAGALRADGLPRHGGGMGPDPDGLGALAAAGPRAEGRRDELALVVEAVHEGYLLHYGEPRLFSSGDRDLDLLAGDRLYALGLARLAAVGDLESVTELADVISLSARAHAEREPALAAAAWEAGATAVGWGASPALERAKSAAGRGDEGACAGLRAAARQLRGGASGAA